MDDAFRLFLSNAKAAAQVVADRENLGADVRSVIMDLIQVCEGTESAQSESVGQSADLRLMKKRVEQSKLDVKTVEKKVESAKVSAAQVIGSIKAINQELPMITNAESADKIRAAVQTLVEVVRDISKL